MEHLLWLGGIATAAMAIWKAAIPAARAIVAMQALMAAQLKANGGSSLVDTVVRTEKAVAANTSVLADLSTRVGWIESHLTGKAHDADV